MDATLDFGIFLGLITAAGVAYGGYRGMQEEGSSFSGTADRLSGAAPGAAPPPPAAGTQPPPPPPPPRAGASTSPSRRHPAPSTSTSG